MQDDSALNELMIVNPGQPGKEHALPSASLFLSDDGTLVQIEGLGGSDQLQAPGEFYLSDDGFLYRKAPHGFKRVGRVRRVLHRSYPVRSHQRKHQRGPRKRSKSPGSLSDPGGTTIGEAFYGSEQDDDRMAGLDG